jgi:LmbE family N-acetylglucosaminyl deacetylase
MSGPLAPPGRAERLSFASALAIAPHYDDEVLGCGGLLAQLAAAGGAVRVLFLTDGGGGREEIAERAAYRERRREESRRAAAVLGLSGCDHLGLPDGRLDHHLDEAVEGIRRAVLTQRPALLLAPSPLEVTADHVAAFAALHRLLAPLRDGALRDGAPRNSGLRDAMSPGGASPGDEELRDGGGDPEEALLRLTVLLYEVNHPAYPDVLVDVSAQAEQLAAAMACYASQEERHPYWNAALGLRRFRTLSLGPGVELAEGYRRLGPGDFSTRSLAQLVAHLGGRPAAAAVAHTGQRTGPGTGPRLSVVVRTRDRPALLAEALDSLAASEYRAAEVVLVNDGGIPPVVPADFPLPLRRVELAESQGRAGAAEAGIAAAAGDFVAFLDDDDLAAPEHLGTLAGLVADTGVRVAYTDAAVAVYELDPEAGNGGWVCRERRLPYSRDFDPDLLLVDNYIPFNTVVIERRLLGEVGGLDRSLPFFEDWDLLIRLAARTAFHHLARVTCEYRHFRGAGHHVFGERPRERGDFLAVKARVLAKHAARLGGEALARATDTLRAEAVAEREERGSLRRELAARQAELAALGAAHRDLARERFEIEGRYHALNGELAALAAEHGRVRAALEAELARLGAEAELRAGELAHRAAEMQRLYDDEAKLRAVADDQSAHLGRTYGEIERLNRQLHEMEATRAWRVHQWWQRRRG